MIAKRRLSASIDADLLKDAEQAVARGEATTMSAWVNEAVRLKLERDQRLRALAQFVAEYEAKHGVISPEEMRAAARSARARAVTVRGPERQPRRRRGGGAR